MGLSERGAHGWFAEGGRALVRPCDWAVPEKDPWLGSLALPLTLNRYGYCTNNPINWIDPSGLLKLKVTITAEAALKGEISTGLLPGGKAEITLKAGASVEIEIEGKDMANVSNKVVVGLQNSRHPWRKNSAKTSVSFREHSTY